ncbi:hypothetical protein D3C85_1275990 [compost metagenome]
MNAGEEGQRLGIIARQPEPDGIIAPLRVAARLAEGRERHQAPVLRLQPGLPVGRGGVADIGGPAVGLHLQQLGEVHVLALGAHLVGPLRRGVELRLLRRRHAPARQRQFPDAVGAGPDDRRGIVGVDVPRLHVADVGAHGASEVHDRLRAAALSVEVAHDGNLSRVRFIGKTEQDALQAASQQNAPRPRRRGAFAFRGR